jgi:branched-chain amino acid transport system permease protein
VPIIACAALALLPALPFMSKYYLLLAFDCLLFAAMAMSLDVLMGYTGLVSFGHAAFFGLGAYSSAVLLERGVRSLWLCAGFAILVVGLYALLVGYFSTARRGIYFALLTLIFAEVVYTFFRYTQTFGGSDGIQGLPAPELLPGVAVDSPLKNYYLVLVFLALAYALCRMLVWSHFGRVLVAIRENEDRARFLGYRVQRYKMAACLISALLTGIAGALYPGRSAFATPDLLLWTVSGELIIMVMIGGIGTLAGPIVGGAFFMLLQEKVSSYVDWYFMVIGLVLIVIVLFMPRGLLGLRRWRSILGGGLDGPRGRFRAPLRYLPQDSVAPANRRSNGGESDGGR